MSPSKVGIISDTHGLLREEALESLKGSDLIIHAGDIGDPNILDALKSLAPLVAVKGNIDEGEPLSLLPSTAILEAGGSTIYVLHRLQDLDLDPVLLRSTSLFQDIRTSRALTPNLAYFI